MLPEHNLQHFPPGFGGMCYPWSLCYMIFCIFLTKWLYKKFNRTLLDKRGLVRGGGQVAIGSFLNLKKGIKTFNILIIWVPSKVCATTSSITKIYIPPGQKLQPFSQALGGGVCSTQSSCYLINELFQTGNLKIWLVAFAEGDVWGGGLVDILRSLMTHKKGN